MSGVGGRLAGAVMLAAAVAVPLALAGERSVGVGTAVRSDADTVVVTMTNGLAYEPAELRIRVGQTVLWRNTSQIAHTVTADPDLAASGESVRLPEGAAPFDSGDLEPGAQFAHTFEVAGAYTYFCIPHERAGMVGRVLVLE